MTQSAKIFLACLLVVLAAAGLSLRFSHLSAHPPQWFFINHTDEGHYSYNTRNALKYGRWFVDDAKYALATPLFSATQYAFARLLPGRPDVVRYRAISVAAGVASALLMMAFVEGLWLRLTVAAFAILSFQTVTHSRMAIAECLLVLMLQLTALLAWRAMERSKLHLSILAGFFVVGCFSVKATGIFILPVVLLAPLVSRGTSIRLIAYWGGLGIGMGVGAALWIVLIGHPFLTEWRQMASAFVFASFGLASRSFGPWALLENLSSFILSPVFQSIPFLWSIALCGCAILLWDIVLRRNVDALDGLIFLWLIFASLGIAWASYQPARWQFVLFPAVIAAAFRVLRRESVRWIVPAGLLLAIALSWIYSEKVVGRFLETQGPVYPAYGMFSHWKWVSILLVVAGAASLVSRVLCPKIPAAAVVILALEFAVQVGYHSTMTLPSFRSNPWAAAAADLEAHLKPADVLTGDAVQNFAFYSGIRVRPTLLVLDEENDTSLRNFYCRGPGVPTHFVLVDWKIWRYMNQMPRLTAAFHEQRHYDLRYGDILGLHRFYVFEINSFDWLDTGLPCPYGKQP